MLLWKTSQSPSIGAEIARRPHSKVQRKPQKLKIVARVRKHDVAENGEVHDDRRYRDDEERYIVKLILLMLLTLLLPAVLMLLYIYFNPDAFQYDITPKQDFSSWHPGKSL